MFAIKTGLLMKTYEKLLKYNYFQGNRFVQVATMDRIEMLKYVKACIPPLDGQSHKGQAGRIGIVGGSIEYTGAPYFAGISALKVGADLVHIFCSSAAAAVIKSYSPELIVHPLLDQPNATSEIDPWLDRLHAIVVGPGLGRDTKTLEVVTVLIKSVCQRKIPLIVDADGLFLINEKPDLLQEFSSPVLLTPNKIEFERLCVKMAGAERLNNLGKTVTILKKGAVDELISNNPELQWQSNVGGSGRRCGGQGDLLSGSIATFLHWTLANTDHVKTEIKADKMMLASSLSCYGASALIRLCNEKAFDKSGRSMLASDMIEFIHESFKELFCE